MKQHAEHGNTFDDTSVQHSPVGADAKAGEVSQAATDLQKLRKAAEAPGASPDAIEEWVRATLQCHGDGH